jgi:hypothetical protein
MKKGDLIPRTLSMITIAGAAQGHNITRALRSSFELPKGAHN